MQIFNFQEHGNSKNSNDCILIFIGQEKIAAKNIDDIFLTWSDKNIPPKKIIILGKKLFVSGLASSSLNFTNDHVDLSRLSKHSELFIAYYDNKGHVVDINSNKNLDDIFSVAVKCILDDFIKNNDVVIAAPPGFYFDKISGRYSSHFIRAEELLRSSDHIEFLALCLLNRFHNWYKSISATRNDTVKIYIDSMSIWPIAEKLIQAYFDDDEQRSIITIESFRSHDGIDSWNPPRIPSFVIISASTSGGLANRVTTKLGNRNVEIITLLMLESIDKSDLDKSYNLSALHTISRELLGRSNLDGLNAKFEPDVLKLPLGTDTISMVGERFLSQSAKPKRIRLTYLSLDEQTRKTLKDVSPFVRVGRVRNDGKSIWAVSFDFDSLFEFCGLTIQQEQKSNLYHDWLRNYASFGPIQIVYALNQTSSENDEVTAHARRMAELTKEMLSKLANNKIEICSSSTLNTMPPDSLRNYSVIVVSPIIGNGFEFKQISARLRLLQPTGPRLLIALAVLPETDVINTQFKNDISIITDDRLYQFKSKFSIPIGKLDEGLFLTEELALLTRLQELYIQESLSDYPDFLLKRIDEIQNKKMFAKNGVFLPSTTGIPLSLTTGFFLWPDSTTISGDDYQGAVLFTAAALLQSSRTAKSGKPETSLKTGLFQHALICPDTFTRFNDSVIQASILRAAYPAELNYSLSKDISEDMCRLILKWVDCCDDSSGYALGEFLMAIGVGKLKMRKSDTEKVLDKIASEVSGWVGKLAELIRSTFLKN